MATDNHNENERIEINKHGGQGSHISARYELMDAAATRRLAEVYGEGAMKYAPDNWRKCSTIEHLRHALHHINSYLEERQALVKENIQGEDHLGHALCRMHMAVAVECQGGPLDFAPDWWED